MNGSFKLFTAFGIGVYVHWSFALLIGYVLFEGYGDAGRIGPAVMDALLVLALFVCVTLHEFGHSLTARHYGIKTRDITLLPIGGMARMERIPEKPSQEFWITINGPAVNFAIFGLLLAALSSAGLWPDLQDYESFMDLPFLAKIAYMNLSLGLFNLVPAFPMDGGRLLRALLATRLNYVKATHIAARIGQAIAILFALSMVASGNASIFTLLMAAFIFMGAGGEARMVAARHATRGTPVTSAMMTRFHSLNAGDPLHAAAAQLLAGSQHDFPVIEGNRLVGLLHRDDLLRAMAEGRHDQPIRSVMRSEIPITTVDASLEPAYAIMQESQAPAMAVLDHGRLVGLLTMENIGEFLFIRNAQRKA